MLCLRRFCPLQWSAHYELQACRSFMFSNCDKEPQIRANSQREPVSDALERHHATGCRCCDTFKNLSDRLLQTKAATNEIATEWKSAGQGWSIEPNICSPRLPKHSLIQTFALFFFFFLFCVNQCKNNCKSMLFVYVVSSCMAVDGILLCSIMIHSFLVIAVHLQAVVYEETGWIHCCEFWYHGIQYIWQVTISTLLCKINK